MRYREERNVASCKTLPKFFSIEDKQLTKICFLIGNDLETSEFLYSVLFCIKSKERFVYLQKYKKISDKQSHILDLFFINS